jgi:hypothetical protein
MEIKKQKKSDHLIKQVPDATWALLKQAAHECGVTMGKMLELIVLEAIKKGDKK